ncbi:MAG TPA: Clp1/GlmU family protein [Actinomycetota bacterium]|nr:Clp1/GlmU family protein [Actinomycetota bacterium]
MTRVTQDALIDRLITSRGTIVLLGGIDTGKTSFGLSVAEAARAQGIAVGYVDADVGQSTIGPPTCVGLKLCHGMDKVDAESVAVADELAFVGSTSPEGHLLPQVASTARLVDHARAAGCELIIVDTSALISGVYAELLKYYKMDLIRPSSVVGFQRGMELDPILGVVSRFFPVDLAVLKVETEVVERSAEERLSAREERLASYFQPPLSRWRVKTTVFMPAIPPETDLAKLDGLVVGLEDGTGTCKGIGLLEYDKDEDVLRMVSTLTEGAKGLRLGSIRITSAGKMLGRVTVRELFGQ